MTPLLPVLIAVGGTLLMLLGLGGVLLACYRKVEPGKALVITTPRPEPLVSFTSAVVLPILHRAELLDMTVKVIDVDCRGADALTFAGGERVDLRLKFFVRVNHTVEDVLKVARRIGCTRASDLAGVRDLFSASFLAAAKTVACRFDASQVEQRHGEIIDAIVEEIGRDLDGFILDQVVVDFSSGR